MLQRAFQKAIACPASTPHKLIVDATRAKVEQNPDVKRVLLATGDLKLRPDHHQPKDATAAWRYYDILTEIRSELQKKQKKNVEGHTSSTEVN